MQAKASRPVLKVSADGTGVVSHAGSRLIADLADAVGLSAAFADAFTASGGLGGGWCMTRVGCWRMWR